jgi:hypothetical protein
MANDEDEDEGEMVDWRAGMLALIERRTDVVLTAEWLDSPRYLLTAAPIPEDPSPPSWTVNSDTDSALRLAPEPIRRATLVWLLEELARTVELDNEPAVREGIAALSAGRLLGSEAERAVYDVRDRMSTAADGVWAAADGTWTTAQRDARWSRPGGRSPNCCATLMVPTRWMGYSMRGTPSVIAGTRSGKSYTAGSRTHRLRLADCKQRRAGH